MFKKTFLVKFGSNKNVWLGSNKIGKKKLVPKKLWFQKLRFPSLVKIWSVTAETFVDKCRKNKCCLDKCHYGGDFLRSIPWPKLCIKSFSRYNEVVNKLDISVGYPYWWNKDWATYFLILVDFRALFMVGGHTVTNRFFIR